MFRLTAMWASARICDDSMNGDKQMTTYNQTASNNDQLDTITQAIETALYYPSSEGNCWDDELLPSGD